MNTSPLVVASVSAVARSRCSCVFVATEERNDQRFVRSITSECLDRMIFVGGGPLRHALAEYAEHYNTFFVIDLATRAVEIVGSTPSPGGDFM